LKIHDEEEEIREF